MFYCSFTENILFPTVISFTFININCQTLSAYGYMLTTPVFKQQAIVYEAFTINLGGDE